MTAARIRAAVGAAMVLAIAACSLLGLPQAQSFNERLAVGYATVATARTSAAELLDSGAISVADATNVQRQADAAREGLDVARAMHAADPGAAETRLDLSLRILTALQTYLKGKSP